MIYLLLFSLLFTQLNHPIHAVNSSTPTSAAGTPLEPTASIGATPTTAPPITNENIQKIREVVQQKVKEKLAAITSTSTGKKAYIGIVDKIASNSITISHLNQQHQLTVGQDTVFIDTKRNKTTLEKITPGQAVLAMGYFNESQILETKRLIIVDAESLENKQHTVVGKIVDISSSSPIFVLVPSSDKDLQYQIKTDTKTKIVLKNKTKLKISQLANGQKVIVIFSPTAANSKTYYAHKIIQLPSATPTENTPTPTDNQTTPKPEEE